MMAIAHLRSVMAPSATPQIFHLLPLLSGPSLLRGIIAILHPHHMAETWYVEALIQTAIPHCKINGAASQAMPQHGNIWVPPHLLMATCIMVEAIPMSVSAYMTVHLLLVDTVMAIILIVQGAALHHMQAGKAKVATVTAVAIARA